MHWILESQLDAPDFMLLEFERKFKAIGMMLQYVRIMPFDAKLTG